MHDHNAEKGRHAIGTVADVEGRIAVLIGTERSQRWQWMNGDWTAIPLGPVVVVGHLAQVRTPPEVPIPGAPQ